MDVIRILFRWGRRGGGLVGGPVGRTRGRNPGRNAYRARVFFYSTSIDLSRLCMMIDDIIRQCMVRELWSHVFYRQWNQTLLSRAGEVAPA